MCRPHDRDTSQVWRFVSSFLSLVATFRNFLTIGGQCERNQGTMEAWNHGIKGAWNEGSMESQKQGILETE